MALRERDKKAYPQFVGRIIEWKNSGWEDGKVQFVRVVGFDYHVGITLVNVNDKNDNFTCMNGPLSPVRAKNPNGQINLVKYDKGFEYTLKVLRTNGVYDVDEKNKFMKHSPSGTGISACAFGQ